MAKENRGMAGFLPSSWRHGWLFGLVLVVATLVAYGPALPAGFVWDDDLYVANNPLLAASDGLRRIWFSFESPSQYFPLTYTTFYVEHALWGLNPAGYHLINILLHTANALLLWRLLTRLRVPGAWLAAAIFALHPVQVESVAWISERKNVLMGFFFLLTLLAWIKFIDAQCRHPWRSYALALLFYALSLSAKTTACTLPAALLLILWLEKMPVNWRRLAQVAPFMAMGIGMGVVSMWWERHHQGPQPATSIWIGPVERVLVASRAPWFYAGKLLWPANLTVNYPRWTISTSDPRAYAWLLASVALGVVIWRARRWTGRGVEVAVAFFVLTLSPLLGFIMVYTFAYSFVADHYQYLACIGPMALAAAGIEIGLGRVAAGKPFFRPVVCAALLMTLGALTWKQSGMYADTETLWQTTLRRNPNSLLAHASLGAAALENGRTDEAIAHLQKVLEFDPKFAGVHYDLGASFFRLGRMDEAIAQYRKELEINPGFALTHNSLAEALAREGKADEAIAEYQKALAIEPDMASANDDLGVILLKKGMVDEAIAHLQKAVQLGPAFIGEQKNLGIAFAKKGQLKEAMVSFQKAVETDPPDAETCNDLAWLLATASDSSLRDGAKALALAQQAGVLAGRENPILLQTQAAAEAETGNFKEAISTARRGLELAVKRKNDPLAGHLQSELKLYEAGVPARDSMSRWK
ncbi:MAG: tetratricopeptide repeat protein [Limisphaerales bacterium]